MSMENSSDALFCVADRTPSPALTATFRLDEDRQDQEEYGRINAVTILHHQIRQGLYSNAQRHAMEHPEAIFSPNSLGWTAFHCSAASSQQMIPENHRLWWIWLLQQAVGRANLISEKRSNVSESSWSNRRGRHPLFETNIKGETPIDLFFAHWIHPHKWTSHDQHLAAAELRRVMHIVCSVLNTDVSKGSSHLTHVCTPSSTDASDLDDLQFRKEGSNIHYCCAFCNQHCKNPMLQYKVEERNELADQIRRVIRRELDDWKHGPTIKMEMRFNPVENTSCPNTLQQEWPIAEAERCNQRSRGDTHPLEGPLDENLFQLDDVVGGTFGSSSKSGTNNNSPIQSRQHIFNHRSCPDPPRDRCIRSWFRRVTYFSKLTSFWQYMELLLMIAHHDKFIIPNNSTADEWSILHAVARGGCPKEVAEFLVSLYPEQCLLKDRHGNMPLHIAMKESTPYSVFAKEFIQTLVHRNANLASCPDVLGRYPLHLGLLKERLWTDGMKEIFFAAPSILYGGVRDTVSGLRPFMAAAVVPVAGPRIGLCDEKGSDSACAFDVRVRFTAITQESTKGMWTFLNCDIQRRAMQSARKKLELAKLETVYQLLRLQPDALAMDFPFNDITTAVHGE